MTVRSQRIRTHLRAAATLAGAIVGAAALLALLARDLGIPAAGSTAPAFALSPPNAALAFALAGFSLAVLARGTLGKMATRVALAAAALVALIGLLTTVEHVFQPGLGIDALLLAPGAAPERMTPATALSLLLLGAALIVAETEVAQWLALLPAVLSLVAAAGYADAALSLHGLIPYTPLSLPTALAFALLAGGVLAARPDRGLTAMLFSPGAAGVLPRILLPTALLLSILAGWARLAGERLGIYGNEAGVGLMVGVTIVALTVVARLAGRSLERAELRRSHAEAMLRQSEEKFRQLFDGAPVGLFRTLPGGIYVAANPALVRMLDAPDRDALLERKAPDFYARREDREAFLRTLERSGVILGEEVEMRTWRGAPLWVQMHATARRDGEGNVLYYEGSVVDITERMRLRQQFLQAQKMEAVGRLAAGVAHDFNNLLTVIMGNATLLGEELPAGAQAATDAREILDAGGKAAALTRQLLAFSRQQVLEPRVVAVNEVVTGLNKMLRRIIGEDIELTTVLAPHAGAIEVDPGELEQVILNLAINSRDAMPTGGKLTLETANVTLDAHYAATHPDVSPGAYVMLAVSDTGSGMDEATMVRIFEPFFTTKEAGKGTGLGLATVYGIVKQSGGHVAAYSEVGRGTTFKVYLPAVTGTVEHGAGPAEESAPAARGTETVLLVEDNREVRGIGRRILLAQGYTVLEAGDAQAAITLAAQHAGAIHIVVTDVVMPGLSGREMVERLRVARPDLKVLFTSGYTDDAVVRHGILRPGVAFLQKPFTRDALISKMRQALRAP